LNNFDPVDSPDSPPIPKNTLLGFFSTMFLIRSVEERIANLVDDGIVKCPCHLYTGQEAVATGVCYALDEEDWVFSTHRSHGHYLAKGGNLKKMLAEIFGKDTGCSRGHGGSMHIADPEKGLPGSSAIVAGTISLAVGTGLAFSIRKQPLVSVAFFGDGATNEGVFYESLNLASLYKLPVLFICENNLYSTHMPIERCLSNPRIFEVARALGLKSLRIDGNNVIEVYHAAKNAVDMIRAGQGPVFLECMTYRWKGHVGPRDDIDKGLRSKDELDSWVERCPIEFLKNNLVSSGTVSEEELREISEKTENEIERAVMDAESGPYPDFGENVHTRPYRESRT